AGRQSQPVPDGFALDGRFHSRLSRWRRIDDLQPWL
ncbi:uncharacterized protein METZ01_LOCUS444474, partial [marine metagenome]